MSPTHIVIGVGAALAFGIAAFGNYYINLLRPQATTEPYGTSTAQVAPTPNPTTPAMPPANTENPTAVFKTNKGEFSLELFMDKMPITAGNFAKLAKEGFYDKSKFHRVIAGFMIQGGDPQTKDDSLAGRWGTGGPGYTIEDEFVPGLSNVRYTISMANTGAPNSGGSQFFINVADNVGLDYDKPPMGSSHPVFGKVISGQEIVDAIAGVPTTGRPKDQPLDPVVIESVTIVE